MVDFTDFSYACLYENKKMDVYEFIKMHVINESWFEYYMGGYSYLHPNQKLELKKAWEGMACA